MKKIVLIFAILALSSFGDTLRVFSLMQGTGSVIQNGFNGGGSAVLQGPQSIGLNPALISIWQRMYKKRVAVSATISKFDEKGILTGGAVSYELTPENIVALDFIYKNPDGMSYSYPGDDDKNMGLYRGVLAISGPLVKEKEQELTVGINLAYHNHHSSISLGDQLPIITSTTINSSTLYDTTFYAVDTLGKSVEQVLTMDVGFFQLDLNKSMTFSLVAENILGYRWLKGQPAFLHDSTLTLLGDTGSVLVDSVYLDKQKTKKKWIHDDFKSILVGGTSRIPIKGTDVVLNIPIDMRFWGFLSKEMRDQIKLKKRVELYTGFEMFKGEIFAGRFGYSWRTPEYKTNENGLPDFAPEHTFSGGASVKINDLLIDAFWGKDKLGGSLTFGF